MPESNKQRVKSVKLPWRDSGLTGRLSGKPAEQPLLLLTHGSHGNCDDPLLKALSLQLGAAGIAVLRFNLPWAEQGRPTPNSDPVLESAWRSVLRFVREEYAPPQIWAGGRSIGCRALVQALQFDSCGLEGVVLLGFPLHPPGRPDPQRITLLQNISVPALAVYGKRDALAGGEMIRRMDREVEHCTVHRLEGGDHAFRGLDLEQTAGEIALLFREWAAEKKINPP